MKFTNSSDLLETLLSEKKANITGGLYEYLQVYLAYHSSRIDDNCLTINRVLNIFRTGEPDKLGERQTYKVKDVEGIKGHFDMFNYMLVTINEPLSATLVKNFHKYLEQCVPFGTSDPYPVGDYKLKVRGNDRINETKPCAVAASTDALIDWYNSLQEVTLSSLASFHFEYEAICPFGDGNGRTGRLILLRECLRNNINPIIIDSEGADEYLKALRVSQVDDNPELVELVFKQHQALTVLAIEKFISKENQ